MDDKKKKFIVPEAESVEFFAEDIIVTSNVTFDAGDAEAGWSGGTREKW